MKNNARFVSLILSLIMIFSAMPAFSASAEEASYKMLPASDLFYYYASPSDLETTLVDTDGGYVHYVAAPGTYNNNNIMFTVGYGELAALDYPYAVVGYRTNSQRNSIDVGQNNRLGENWMNNNPAQKTDGSWSTLFININDINGNTQPNLPKPGETEVTLRFKPWGSHTKTLGVEQYYDLRFVAFFKNEAEAKAFKFDPNTKYESEISPEYMENIPYHEATDELINKYLAEAEALKESIINSPSSVKWTGTAYYVSPKGNDENDGLTPATAFKTVDKVSHASFLKEGDAVLFERGGTYRTTGYLATKNGITYSAYGSGAKPKIIGSIDASYEALWRETEHENVYAFTPNVGGAGYDIGQIVFDMGKAWGIKLQNGLWIGTNSNGLGIIESGTPIIDGPEDIKHDLEYWHDWDRGTVYLYSKDGNPASRFTSIEIVDKGNGISGGANNVVIDNLELFGFGSHGIGYGGIGDAAKQNLTVQYCIFSFIGGSRQYTDPSVNTRFGNAVEIYGAAKGFIIHDCYANNVYDCCWTIQYQSDSEGVDVWFEDVEFYNNVACYSNTGLEVWLNNKAEYNNDAVYGMKNMRLHHNYTYYNGYGWSQQRPNKDGNIFYGDPSVTNTVYENCSVDHNVGLFASKWINYLRYVGSNYYNFNNNVYFQHENKLYGGVPANPEKGTGAVGQHKYERATMSRLLATGFEKGSVFYYTKEDYKIPQYDPALVSFDDITEKHWAYDYVKTAVMRNYFNGTAPATFSPDTSMTRAMLVTVLSRITNEKAESKKATYTDVNASAWYANAVNWAYSAGLVADGITKFRPDDAVTREELADMLYRLTLNQYKTNEYDGKALDFSDASSVSPEYKAGVAFATDIGVISGYTDGSVKPKNTATRAEVATMICRFVQKYYGFETDFSKMSDATDSKIFAGNELNAILATSPGDKRMMNKDTENPLVRLIPQHISQSSAKPQLLIFERISNVDFAKYPYIKLRMKTTSTSTGFKLWMNKNGASGEIIAPIVTDEWCDVVVCIYDIINPDTEIYNGELNASLYISPWSEIVAPGYNVDYCDIEYIGFFPTKAAAQAYQSDFQKNSVTVTYMFGSTEVTSLPTKKGQTLTYPNITPSRKGYTFKGWDIAEGTVINDNLTVNAVFEKTPGVPMAVFTADNTESTATGGLSSETVEENGIKYVHFYVPDEVSSKDGTRANLILSDSEAYNVATAPIIKICYRTNIASSSAIDFNLRPDQGNRLWGPFVDYAGKGEWVEQIIDLSKLGWNGGEDVVPNLTSEEYFNEYFKDTLYSFIFKPYKSNGLLMRKDEYFDFKYVAFFETEEDAKIYKFDK
ncbi:MAG: S-layer homology domain-containing protein [Clostridia bacterium]|nr:S-layer homology domain-containing protein [Clostridia bacterium]